MIKDSVTVSFFLRSRSKEELPKIYMRLIVSREKTEISLGHSINPDEWDEARQRTKKNKAINEEIAFNENKILEIKRELQYSKKQITLKTITNRLRGIDQDNPTLLFYFSAYVDKLEKQPSYSRIMVQKYRNCINKLKDYLLEAGEKDVLIRDINYRWIQNFDHYLLSCINTSINKPIGRNTANKQHARLKCILEQCHKEGLIQSDPYTGIRFGSVKSQREYLTIEELDQIAAHDLGNNLSLEKVRDIFFFSVYSGLRYIDATNLRQDDITTDRDGKLWIEVKQEKTNERCTIPMLKKAIEIFEKYKVERIITGFVLPRMSNQKINVYLKTIAELVGIKKKVTHHIARHTFATTITLSNEIPLEVVSKWLGHSSVKTSQIYAKISKQYSGKMADKLNDKLI